MIIRLFGYAVRDGAGPDFEGLTQGAGFAALTPRPGILFCYAARSFADPGRGVVVSGWATYEDLLAAVGNRIDRPRLLPKARSMVTAWEVSHWEGLDLPSIGSAEPSTALRVLRGSVVPGSEATYFDYVRHDVWQALPGVAGIAGCWVGRQSDGIGSEPVLTVSAWTSREALAAAIDPPIAPVFRVHHGTLFHAACSQELEVFAQIPDGRGSAMSAG